MNSTSGLQTPLAIGQAEIALQHIRITRYTTAAAVVVLIYDTLLTFGDEVIVGYNLEVLGTHSLPHFTGSISLAWIPHSR